MAQGGVRPSMSLQVLLGQDRAGLEMWAREGGRAEDAESTLTEDIAGSKRYQRLAQSWSAVSCGSTSL